MDWQAAFNVVIGLLGAFGGYIMKIFHDEIKDNREELLKLPSTYARRDDVREMKQDIIDTLKRIEDKVDRKYG